MRNMLIHDLPNLINTREMSVRALNTLIANMTNNNNNNNKIKELEAPSKLALKKKKISYLEGVAPSMRLSR